MRQAELTFPPASHSGDPNPARQGADEVTASGRRSTQMQLVLDVVVMEPGLTAGEIGELTGLGHVRAQRRLSDLKNMGRVIIDGQKPFNGHAQSRWWPSQKGDF